MKKIKLASETIDKKELIALSNWIKTVPKLTMGYKTEQFEKKWSKWVGMKYSVFLNSGSSAILGTFQTLKEMKILKNNKVIIPAICWSTDFSSLTALGYKTVVCDCNLNDLSVSVEELEKLIKKYNPHKRCNYKCNNSCSLTRNYCKYYFGSIKSNWRNHDRCNGSWPCC